MGDRTAKLLDKQLEIRTVGDLLGHYPRRYVKRGELSRLDALPLGLPFPGLWKVRFNSDSPHYAPEFGGMDAFDVEADGPAMDGCEQSAVLMLGPYSAVVLTREV